MTSIEISDLQKEDYNLVVSHPLQAFEWGEFRKRTGIKVIRHGFIRNKKLTSGFQMTIHPIPHTPFNVGYIPKGSLPTKDLLEELITVGETEKCIFIQLEPNIENGNGKQELDSTNYDLRPSARPLFTKYTFVLDITKPEEELLKNMHPKTRYNIKVAQKRGVQVQENDSEKAFKRYLSLTRETTTRQGFYAHTEKYHKLMWNTLAPKTSNQRSATNNLTAHLLTATYQEEILVTWILFSFHDTLYYPYGASSSRHREVMASNLMMWEAIRFGKKMGLKKFDMWGALTVNPDTKDPWYGFHRFKEGYGAKHTEFIGSFDLVIQPHLYTWFKLADKLRWFTLRMKTRLINR